MLTLDPILEAIAERLAEKTAARLLEQPQDKLMTVTEAALYSGLSRQTIRNLVKSGDLKKAKGLKDTRLRRSVLDEYGK